MGTRVHITSDIKFLKRSFCELQFCLVYISWRAQSFTTRVSIIYSLWFTTPFDELLGYGASNWRVDLLCAQKHNSEPPPQLCLRFICLFTSPEQTPRIKWSRTNVMNDKTATITIPTANSLTPAAPTQGALESNNGHREQSPRLDEQERVTRTHGGRGRGRSRTTGTGRTNIINASSRGGSRARHEGKTKFNIT